MSSEQYPQYRPATGSQFLILPLRLAQPIFTSRCSLHTTMIFASVHANSTPIGILHRRDVSTYGQSMAGKLTSNTSSHPLMPVSRGEWVVPHLSNQSIHRRRSSLPRTESVTGSQPRSFCAWLWVWRNSRKSPDQSVISQTTANREPSDRRWSSDGTRRAPTTRSYQAIETSRLETANFK